jgi:hypothetical protein
MPESAADRLTPDRDPALERDILRRSRESLHDYAAKRDWAGYDPRDALRSPLLSRLPGRWAKIAATQGVLRLPWNVRPLLGYGPAHDPKALSLFLRSYLRGVPHGNVRAGRTRDGERELESLALVFSLLSQLPDVRDRGPFGWGYPFPWQSRHLFVPAHSPNAVATAFVGEALLEIASGEAGPGAPPVVGATVDSDNVDGDNGVEVNGEGDSAATSHPTLEISDSMREAAAVFAAQTALYALRIHPGRAQGEAFFYHYTQHDTNEIHNASLLVGAFLARYAAVRTSAPADRESLWEEAEAVALDAQTPEARHALDRDWTGGGMAAECWDRAARVALHGVKHQDSEGGWAYGTSPAQQWFDSFHTGYNLQALRGLHGDLSATSALAGDMAQRGPAGDPAAFLDQLEEAIDRGYRDYRRRFFGPEGTFVSYFQHGAGPLDSHAVGHAALTLAANGEPEAAREQLLLLTAEMMDPCEGYYYYQRRGAKTPNKVAYLRWTQAWMMWALTGVLAFEPTN